MKSLGAKDCHSAAHPSLANLTDNNGKSLKVQKNAYSGISVFLESIAKTILGGRASVQLLTVTLLRNMALILLLQNFLTFTNVLVKTNCNLPGLF